jgi:hypothetical protein
MVSLWQFVESHRQKGFSKREVMRRLSAATGLHYNTIKRHARRPRAGKRLAMLSTTAEALESAMKSGVGKR